MPANETYRDPYYVPIQEPGTNLVRDISSMGIASKDGAAGRAQQEKILLAKNRAKSQDERITHIENTINTMSKEQVEVKNLLSLILEKMGGQ